MDFYKILNYNGSNKFDFIVSENLVRNYTLMENGKEILYAEDNENGLKFRKKLGNEFDYSDLDNLHLFLNLIEHFDSKLFETYEVMQKVTVV